MKTKSCIILLVFICSLLFVLAGCTTPIEVDPSLWEFDPDNDYTVEFFGWGEAEEIANYKALIADFERTYPNITVVYNAVSSATYMTTLRNRANNLPDLFYMPDYEFLQWADAGRLMDLSSHVDAQALSDVWTGAIDEYYYNRDTYALGRSSDSGLYGLPKDLGPFTLVYNKTLLQQLAAQNDVDADILGYISADQPMTWAQFRTLLKALDDGKPTTDASKKYGITHYELQSAIYSNNAAFFTDDAETQRISEKNFIDALQFIADLHLVDGVMPAADDQSSTNGYVRFKAGNSVFSFMGPWDCTAFWKDCTFEYDVIPVPYGPAEGARSTTWVGSMAYSMSAKTKVPAAALKLAEYLTYNADCQRTAYSLGQQVPNIVSMAQDEYIHDTKGLLTGKGPANRAVFVDIMDGFSSASDKVGGKTRATYYTYNAAWLTDFTDYIEDLWTGAKTAEQLMNGYKDIFQSTLEDMIDEYKY